MSNIKEAMSRGFTKVLFRSNWGKSLSLLTKSSGCALLKFIFYLLNLILNQKYLRYKIINKIFNF